MLQATGREGGTVCEEGGRVGRERGVRPSHLPRPKCSLRGALHHVIPGGSSHLTRTYENHLWRFKWVFGILPRGSNEIVRVHLPLRPKKNCRNMWWWFLMNKSVYCMVRATTMQLWYSLNTPCDTSSGSSNQSDILSNHIVAAFAIFYT